MNIKTEPKRKWKGLRLEARKRITLREISPQSSEDVTVLRGIQVAFGTTDLGEPALEKITKGYIRMAKDLRRQCIKQLAVIEADRLPKQGELFE